MVAVALGGWCRGFWFSETAGDHAEFEQAAFDGSVKQRHPACGRQTQQAGELQVGGKNLDGPSAEALF